MCVCFVLFYFIFCGVKLFSCWLEWLSEFVDNFCIWILDASFWNLHIIILVAKSCVISSKLSETARFFVRHRFWKTKDTSSKFSHFRYSMLFNGSIERGKDFTLDFPTVSGSGIFGFLAFSARKSIGLLFKFRISEDWDPLSLSFFLRIFSL